MTQPHPSVPPVAPLHVPAAHHNSVRRRAQARADELEQKLADVLMPILHSAADEAARNFEKYATNHLTASMLQQRRENDAWLLASMPRHDARAVARSLGLTAAIDVPQNGTMICLRPRPDEAAHITDPDGYPPEQLHVTLVYLGEVEGPLDAIVEEVQEVAARFAPLTGTVGGYGQFQQPDGSRVGILLPDVPGLVELRVDVTEELSDAGIDYGRNHGFAAHLTVDDEPEPGELDEMLQRASGLPLHFDDLIVCRGDTEEIRVPLVGAPAVTAAGDPGTPTNPGWTPPARNEVVDADALVKKLHTKTDPVRQAAAEAIISAGLEPAGLSFDVDNPFTRKVLAQSGSQIVGISQTTQLNAMRIIGASYKQGLSIPDTATAIRAGMKEASPARATLIARCLPPDTPIDAAVVRAVTRRWYEGYMAVVVTESGREFTATPNHPMLTIRGWRPTGEIEEGDYLVCCRREKNARTARDENVGDPPPSIAEVFDTAAAVGIVERRTGREPDFHGDGGDGEVEIAWPYRELALGRFAALYEHSLKHVLAPTVVADGPLFCSRCRRMLPIDKSTCLCAVSRRDSRLPEYAADERVGYTERVRERLHAFSTEEPADDLVYGGVVAAGWRPASAVEIQGARIAERSALDVCCVEPVEDGALVHSNPFRDSRRARPSDIEADRVVACRLIPYSGHVFNLCTPYGYFTVNGGYTGNTELSGVVNGGSLAAVQQVAASTGQTYRKVWLCADGAKYPRHADYDGLDGQERDLNEPFDVGGFALDHPGDPSGPPEEICACRCAVAYADGTEVSADDG